MEHDLKSGQTRRWVVGADGVKRWADNEQPCDGPWGRGDLMALAAVRYCLGRMSYIVGDCHDWLVAQWPQLSESIRKTIARDVEEAIARDDEVRANGGEYKPLGMDMDRQQWVSLRKLWNDA